MFSTLKAEIEARFDAIELYFHATKNFTGDNAQTAKGLIFVQVYAVYEYTVCSVIRLAIDAIKGHNHKLKDIAPSLLALFLDPELKSLRDSGGKGVWNKRLRVFERAFSNEKINLSSNNNPPHDGSHFRYTQLVTIFRVFGISRLPVRRRSHIPRIDEVVGHRNKIAHGSETAEDIGRRYARSEILHIVRQMKSVCELQITVFDTYCSDRAKHRR